MATYDQLPVYKASYDLLICIFEFSKNFNKEYKYTIGEKIKNETLELILLIYRANSVETKAPVIQTAREHIEVLRLLIRLTKDLRQISLPKFVEINEKIENVSKQLTGWQKSVKSQKVESWKLKVKSRSIYVAHQQKKKGKKIKSDRIQRLEVRVRFGHGLPERTRLIQ